MIILIRRRKTSVMIDRFSAAALAWSGVANWFSAQPTATPRIMAPTMKVVNRRFMRCGPEPRKRGSCGREAGVRPSRFALVTAVTSGSPPSLYP